MFNIDVDTCRACGGAVRIIACIEDPLVIEKILTHLDQKSTSIEASRLPPCRGRRRRDCSADTEEPTRPLRSAATLAEAAELHSA